MREEHQGSGSPTYINDTTDVSIATHGLFKYAPRCCRKVFLSAAGLLFFLCWASTLQVSALQSILVPSIVPWINILEKGMSHNNSFQF